MIHHYDPLNDPYRFMPEIPGMDKPTEEEQQEVRVKALLLGCGAPVLAFMVVMLLALLFGSCTTTRYVPVIEHKTDTLIQTQVRHDSIYFSDSIYISDFVRDDTVWRTEYKWRTRYIERTSHDTTYVSKTDTIPQPYPVEVPVEKALTWWQQTRLMLGNVLLLAMGAAAAWWVVRRRLR